MNISSPTERPNGLTPDDNILVPISIITGTRTMESNNGGYTV